MRSSVSNTRIAYIHEGATLNKVQETHYYPFGHRISPLSNQQVNLGTERNNAYLYSGRNWSEAEFLPKRIPAGGEVLFL